jgi:excisionase family DNA binding protein
MKSEKDGYCSPEEIANTLKISVGEVLGEIKRGELRAVQVDGSVRIAESDVKRWLPDFLDRHPLCKARQADVMDLPPGYRWCRTASGKARFPVRGSITSGAQMLSGTMQMTLPYFDADFLAVLLDNFRGRAVRLGQGFQHPAPPNTLAQYIQNNLPTMLNPVGYLAGLLIDEGHATLVESDYILFAGSRRKQVARVRVRPPQK